MCSFQNQDRILRSSRQCSWNSYYARQSRCSSRFSVPQCIKDVRSFIGLASYYCKFVKGFATIAEPLTRLLGKQTRFEWNPQAQKAFEALKEALMQATSLAFPIRNVRYRRF